MKAVAERARPCLLPTEPVSRTRRASDPLLRERYSGMLGLYSTYLDLALPSSLRQRLGPIGDNEGNGLVTPQIVRNPIKTQRQGGPYFAIGRETEKVEPRPTTLSTRTEPPCCSTMSLAMDSPRPAPGLARERALSAL